MIRAWTFCILFVAGLFCGVAGANRSTTFRQLIEGGDSLMRIPDYANAFRNYRLADSLHPNSAEAAVKLALIDNIFTRSREAIFRLDAAKKNLATSNIITQVSWYQQRGRAYEDIGDIEQAGRDYRTGLNKAQQAFGIRSIHTAYALMFMARYHSFRKENDSSYGYSNRAYSIWKESGTSRQLIRQAELLLQHAFDTKNRALLSGRARVAQYDSVRTLYTQTLRLIKQLYSNPSAEEAAVYQGLANTYNDLLQEEMSISKQRGEVCWNSGISYYDKSIATKEALFGPVHRSVAVSYYTRGLMFDIHPDTARMKQGLWEYQKAMRAAVVDYSPTNGFSLPERCRVVFPYQLNVVLTQYNYLARKLHSKTGDNRYLEAAHRANLYRLSVFDEIVSQFSSNSSGNTIWIWVNALFEESVETGYDLYVTTGDKRYLEQVFNAIERGRNNDFAEQIVRQHNSGKGVVYSNSGLSLYRTCTPLDSLQRALKSTSAYIALVGWSRAWKGRSFALAVTNKNCIVIELPQPGSVDSLRTALFTAMRKNQAYDYARAARLIYAKSLESVLNKLDSGITELILSVNGVYSDIPFDALVKKKPGLDCDFTTLPYLMDQYTIRYCLSATQLVQYSNENSTHTRLTGFTPEFTSHSALVFSARSAKVLQHRFAGKWFSGSQATSTHFLEALGEHNIVHIASHADVNPTDADASSLLLKSDSGEERLFLHQLLGLRVHAPLVVVAACETAAGKEQYAEGSRTFARGLLFAGAGSTIGTLWRVDDKSTAALLEHFYNALAAGQGTAEALRTARQQYRSASASPEAANPFFWAGLVLTGADQSLLLHRNDAHWPFWLIGAGGIAAVIVWRVVKKRRLKQG